jgi:hypothetical protein
MDIADDLDFYYRSPAGDKPTGLLSAYCGSLNS